MHIQHYVHYGRKSSFNARKKGQDMTWFVHQNIIVANIDEDYL